MFGIDKTFECKKCKVEQTHNIGITKLYKVNKLEGRYIPVRCFECGALHFVAETGHVLDEITEEAKEKSFEEASRFIGTSDYARQRFFEQVVFITKEQAVLSEEEVTEYVEDGVCCF